MCSYYDSKGLKRKVHHSDLHFEHLYPNPCDDAALLRARDDPKFVTETYAENEERVMQYEERGGFMKIRAVAGAGKSTLIQKYVRAKLDQCRDAKVIVLMFNRLPTSEMAASFNDLKESVKVQTIDSFFGTPACSLDVGWDTHPWMQDTKVCCNPYKHKNSKTRCITCRRDMWKSFMTFLWSKNRDPVGYLHCKPHVAKGFEEAMVPFVKELWKQAKANVDTLTTTAILCKLAGLQENNGVDPLQGYTHIVIDEGQDMSDAEAFFFMKKRDWAVRICVGDAMQDINNFRGSSGAFKTLACNQDVVLPCTWRFGYPLNAFVEKMCSMQCDYGKPQILSSRSETTAVIQVAGISHCFELVSRTETIHSLHRTNASMFECIIDLLHHKLIKSTDYIVADGLQKKFGNKFEVIKRLDDWYNRKSISASVRSMLCVPPWCKTFDDFHKYCRNSDIKDKAIACDIVKNLSGEKKVKNSSFRSLSLVYTMRIMVFT